MLPLRIFRNRWHALLFAGLICVLAAEFASDVSVPPATSIRTVRPDAAGLAAHTVSTPEPSPADTDQGLFADLFAPSRGDSGPPARMLPLDTDGDGVPDTTAREVR